jgi:hypothetical protein
MRSQDYLKQAASALRRAADARKIETEELRRQLDQKDQEVKQQINDLRRQEGEEMALAAQADSDRETADHMRNAELGQVEESRIGQQYNYDRRQLSQQLKDMQNSVYELEQQARDLENQAAG